VASGSVGRAAPDPPGVEKVRDSGAPASRRAAVLCRASADSLASREG